MSKINWNYDEITKDWAIRCPLPIATKTPIPQYDGSNYHPWEETWKKHILRNRFPDYCRSTNRIGTLVCSPTNIIKCFQESKVLESLVLIVGWGSLTRTKGKIYDKSLQQIEETLLKCMTLTEKHNSIEGSWNLLVDDLGWSYVITSKTLHFLARSLGYESNPPVPIDNKVILDEVWPAFRKTVKKERILGIDVMPEGWWDRVSSWQPYNRYMTAINSWAHLKGWTTTQIENTLFQEYYPSN